MLIPLLPTAMVFSFCVRLRRFLYTKKFLPVIHLPVPVIIVGNITVGGTGKTPMVIWLADFLKLQGLRPGIVSRGVGGKRGHKPHLVQRDDPATLVGDEALLLLSRTNCPVVISIDRPRAAQYLLKMANCNVIISDDGLQHYKLGRDVEIVMIDALRQLGNRRLLPAGPLREPASRLDTADFVVENGIHSDGYYTMALQPAELISIFDSEKILSCSRQKKPLAYGGFKMEFESSSLSRKIHAVAGIGNPEQFFTLLEELDFDIIPHVFPDHYHFKADDLNFKDELPIIMTEKDAVKYRAFESGGNKNFWYLKINAVPNINFINALSMRLNEYSESLCAKR